MANNEIKIHPQAIVDFVADNFEDRDYFVRNDKVRVNTPFKSQNPKPDEKFHLAIFLIEKNGYPVGSWNCFRTNRTGTFQALVKELKNCSYQDSWKIIHLYNKKYANDEVLVKKFVSKERELVLPQGISCVLHEPSRKYLLDRNVSDLDIIKHNLYYCTEDCRYRDRIIFPFFENEKVVFFTSRLVVDQQGQDRYLHHYGSKSNFVYNIDNASLNPLIVVEGIFDAILSNGVSIVGNKISDKQIDKILNKKPEKIFVMMDLKTVQNEDDKTYHTNMCKVLTGFLQRGYKELYVFDPNKNYDFKDFGSLSKDKIQEALKEMVPLTISVRLKFRIL